jgi:hypothetical protein
MFVKQLLNLPAALKNHLYRFMNQWLNLVAGLRVLPLQKFLQRFMNQWQSLPASQTILALKTFMHMFVNQWLSLSAVQRALALNTSLFTVQVCKPPMTAQVCKSALAGSSGTGLQTSGRVFLQFPECWPCRPPFTETELLMPTNP